MSIRVFITGGTFDKEYDELRGSLFFKDTHVPEMLRLGRCQLDVSVRTLMMIDSLEMTEADRGLIVSNCRQCAETRIVITHGTDTMVETAGTLAAARLAKTIILTGAMIANLSPALAEELAMEAAWAGVAVINVDPESTARRMQFRPGDIILEVNGVAIDQVSTLIATLDAASRWQFTIKRGGKVQTFTIG